MPTSTAEGRHGRPRREARPPTGGTAHRRRRRWEGPRRCGRRCDGPRECSSHLVRRRAVRRRYGWRAGRAPGPSRSGGPYVVHRASVS